MQTERPFWVDAVEKIALLAGVILLGGFDPADLGRLSGFAAA